MKQVHGFLGRLLTGTAVVDVAVGPEAFEEALFPLVAAGGGGLQWVAGLGVSLGLLVVLDVVLAMVLRMGRSRWYVLHAVMNLLLTHFAWTDLAQTFGQPTAALTSRRICSVMPVCIHLALHLYHLLAYLPWNRTLDLFAHAVCLLLFPPLLFSQSASPLINSAFVFLAGAPLGLDYVLAALVRTRALSPPAHDRANRSFILWVRAPALLYHVSFGYIQASFLDATLAPLSAFQWAAVLAMVLGSLPVLALILFHQPPIDPDAHLLFF